MKRYILFAYAEWEAFGGTNDFKNDFDSVEEAIEYALSNCGYCDKLQVLDLKTGQIREMEID